ncbi:molybdopterin biosynthesis protein [Desulfohalobium retbaense]|uniref:Molybdopterin molybdenumtransferase n=1 Tax=Desulfohalobium retbaense (strain ATCC 49708 / DSM 5692 / JCM 16813 / HR100) TaxID=485915 RepID=C8X4C0_DESRD|nr:molybdopterin biosynthesis protein [Desulfohalobium retbaense]ACV69394.1 molybdenum cofactor synthesis domain protein [Desulfohalobium retbaense DSM 5692]
MGSERTIYLQMQPIEQALETVQQELRPATLLGHELVATEEAVGRVTAEAVYAQYSSPTFHGAAMDGIAVRAADTFAAREGAPVHLERNTGFVEVNTGNPLPDGMNAVIMVEHIDFVDSDTVAIEAPAFPWQHVRRIGEDIVATELLLPQNHTLTPYDTGALLSAGIWELAVWQQPVVEVIPTGDEVLDFRQRPEPRPGQVVESNSQVLAGLARQWGAEVRCQPPVADDESILLQAVQDALDGPAHVVVIGAGSSAGSKDFSRRVMEQCGRILVHGITAMPGKPSLLGVAANGKLLVGAPGYPVSAVVCYEQLLQPLLAQMQHKPVNRRPVIEVEINRKLPSKLGVDEFVRLAIGKVGDKWVGTPLARGAGMITTLTRAQGVARIPTESEGVEAGQTVRAELFVPAEEVERVLVAVGSHDNTLDLLANALQGLKHPIGLASSHVGSMGGLTALQNGSVHIAGAHLYDPESGDYNFPFLQRYLADIPVTAVNLAIRHQGLIVPRGNPKGIQGIQDLTRDDVRFINRQRGAGTRILLDDHLHRAGLSAREVNGYGHEEFTHMAVAVNVLSGAADCGMGIYAAAKALDLDFVPLARERYDLLIPTAYLEDEKIRSVLDLLGKPEFQQEIESLGGYDTHLTGQVMQPGMGLGEG